MAAEKETNPDFKYLVRIVNTDLDGNKPVHHALLKIKGVSFMFANIACALARVDKFKKTGYISDIEAQRLDEVIRFPQKYGAPVWMLNRRKDYETGEDKHLLLSDMDYVRSNDIRRLQMIKSYRGARHAAGQPCRGQSTKSHFRRNKGKVLGVKRSSTQAPAKEKEKK
ncbi:30S ribosomal protein S13 [Candidatus Woesearchaeota archaeon]|nr:30S ribosomal protein S13 [Candidatus Woesearchaeota archaeon]